MSSANNRPETSFPFCPNSKKKLKPQQNSASSEQNQKEHSIYVHNVSGIESKFCKGKNNIRSANHRNHTSKLELHLGQYIYMPPGRARGLQTNEFIAIISSIKLDYSSHFILICGGMNFPDTICSYDSNSMTMKIINFIKLSHHEQRFHTNCDAYGLKEINRIPKSRGNHLDLIFTDANISNVQLAANFELLDKNSTHHFALKFFIEYSENYIPPMNSL